MCLGYTVFPDSKSPNALSWWIDESTRWHEEIAFDGMWIDMYALSPQSLMYSHVIY